MSPNCIFVRCYLQLEAGRLPQYVIFCSPSGPTRKFCSVLNKYFIDMPHQTVKEDVYEGHRIPKGAIISANIW